MLRRVAFGGLFAINTAVVAAMALSDAASAQQANQGRDCQTVRTCNFSRTGAVRGCLSSYSCRQCRTVTVRCRIPGAGPVCQEVRCDWGA
jgi:hypothetical protein